ncbi:hypothetical protein M3Y99_00143800 [Aphelenchoides fujianensis]|nr:hypothetical protein M3Y99_00143800 [Aphelenchoides fujianensis]
MASEVTEWTLELPSDPADGEAPPFELVYHSCTKFEQQGQEEGDTPSSNPSVLFLCDRPFDAALLTDESHPWVSLARELNGALWALKLRGFGKSQLPKGQKAEKSVDAHLEDVSRVIDNIVDEFGPREWIFVGREFGGSLAFWSRLTKPKVAAAALVLDPEVSCLEECGGKKVEEYETSNIVLATSGEGVAALRKFADKHGLEKLVLVEEKQTKTIVDHLKFAVGRSGE